MQHVLQNLLKFHKFSESIPFRGTKALHKHPTSETGTLLRKEAKVNSPFSNYEVPNNVKVDVIESKGDFSHVLYKKFDGWIRTEYLTHIQTPQPISTIPSASSSTSNSTQSYFSLVTYNLLFSSMAAKPSDWEKELIEKTMKMTLNKKLEETKCTVDKGDVIWKNRFPRLLNNMLIDGKIADILLFQETTPEMLKFLLETLQISDHYGFVQSKFGCCGNNNGYCFVCWDKNVFGQKLDEYHSSYKYCRIVGVQLKFGDREFLVCSTHLPASGTENKKIGEHVSQELQNYPFPVIIGGDFNVVRNYFTKCPQNLSGKASTFYNGGYDNNDVPQLEEAKFDWVVGTKDDFNLLSLDINPISGEKRWPNKTEGSDHTSIRLKLSLKLSLNS